MARIHIEDLPVRVELTPEEMEQLWGAGRPAFRPQLEALEERLLMSGGDWFSRNIPNVNVAALARKDWSNHGSINYNDMLGIYRQVAADGYVDSSEFRSLQSLYNNRSALHTPDSVGWLEGAVVNGNPANRFYQGGNLGNLGPGSSGYHLQLLVNKWFLGLDHPAIDQGLAYSPSGAGGGVFGGTISYTDVAQGGAGDCALLASFAEVAAKYPGNIWQMFTANGNETFTIRFYENGSPVYVTVDNQLPTYSGWAGMYYYDHPVNNVYWATLYEKAYAQLNEFDPQDGVPASLQGRNSYKSLWGLQSANVLQTVTNVPAYITNSPGDVAQALTYGRLIVVSFGAVSGNPHVETDHAYAVIGYTSSTGLYTLFNPWGINGGTDPKTHQQIWGQFTAPAWYLERYCTDTGGWVRAAHVTQATEGTAGADQRTALAPLTDTQIARAQAINALLNGPAPLGWDTSLRGHASVGDEIGADGVGRYQHFDNSSVFWSPQTGAHEVQGAIRDAYARQGFETGALGYPTSDEYAWQGGLRSDFQNGYISWTSSDGARVFTFA